MWVLLLIIFLIIPIQTYVTHQEYYLKFASQLPQYTQYTVDVTFYSLDKTQTDSTPKIGALNTKLKVGRDIAVSRDLSFLLGKWVYIEGYGKRYVADLMHTRFRNRIDILVPNKKIAQKLGIKRNKKLIIIQ